MNARKGSAFLQIDPSDLAHFTLFVSGSKRSDDILLTVKGAQYGVSINDERSYFNMASVHNIIIDARDGDDEVLVSHSVTLGCEIHGGNGNDFISGGSGNDLIYGDAGRDLILGNRGDDTLYGGPGHDLLIGGSGNNHLFQ